MPADFLIANARIYTAEERTPTAEAMAVRDGRIVGIGSRSEVEVLAGPATRTFDLGGRTVIPGLIDAHVHLLSFALGLSRVKLTEVASLWEAVERVRTGVAGLKPGEWLLGEGWDKNLWNRLPTRLELDAVSPANPVLLVSKDMHTVWANSLALKLGHVGRDTADPAGGEILRDPASGEPTGLLRESATKPIYDAVPSPSPERCEQLLAEALRIAASKGLTGIQIPEGPATFDALQRLKGRGALPLRLYCHLQREYLQDALRVGVRTGFGDEWLRFGHLKLFMDGALGSQTAHMLEPYDGTDSRGIETLSREELTELVSTAAAGGIAPAIHAIGDAANRVVLDVLEETAPIWRSNALRSRIEHVQLLHQVDAHRLGELGVVASMQPGHQPSDWMVADRFWGERNALAYAWRTVRDSGAILAFGSDCPVEPIDPMLGLHAAVSRQTPDGQPAGGWHPGQRLSPFEALQGYTIGAAFASGEESFKGSLAPGKVADLVVLSLDPFAGPHELFLRAKVEATMVDGRLVYGEL